MTTNAPKLLTVGLLAELLNTTPDRVSRILRSRPHIRPSAYAGHVRLFHGSVLPELRLIVNTQDARRAAKGGAK